MKVYYAHSMHLYNTPQEFRDIQLLQSLGFEVFNPNQDWIQAKVNWLKKSGDANYMGYFKNLIDDCDCVAYRSHVDLKIPSGVWFEVDYAIQKGKPVFELPTIVSSRILDLKDTVKYLEYNGQR